MLLLIHDNGKFDSSNRWSLDHALAGSVLMDLALEDRIDTDIERLILVDATPVGDALLDPMLARIAQEGEPRDARHWVQQTAGEADRIRETALDRLTERGILEKREERFLWLLRSKRYPVVNSKTTREVKERIMKVLFSDEIPEPRDVVLIGLADACQIFRQLLPCRELDEIKSRIKQVRDLDLIGRAVFQAIYNLSPQMKRTCNVHYPKPCPT